MVNYTKEIIKISGEVYLPTITAAENYGYSVQYLRRLLRQGRVTGLKIGQIWIVCLSSLECHLQSISAKATKPAISEKHKVLPSE